MKTMLPTEVRDHWKQVLKEVADEAEEVRIHLKGGRGIVMMPEEMYESVMATMEVMSDPKAVRAIRRQRAGLGRKHTLAEVDKLIGSRG